MITTLAVADADVVAEPVCDGLAPSDCVGEADVVAEGVPETDCEVRTGACATPATLRVTLEGDRFNSELHVCWTLWYTLLVVSSSCVGFSPASSTDATVADVLVGKSSTNTLNTMRESCKRRSERVLEPSDKRRLSSWIACVLMGSSAAM